MKDQARGQAIEVMARAVYEVTTDESWDYADVGDRDEARFVVTPAVDALTAAMFTVPGQVAVMPLLAALAGAKQEEVLYRDELTEARADAKRLVDALSGMLHVDAKRAMSARAALTLHAQEGEGT